MAEGAGVEPTRNVKHISPGLKSGRLTGVRFPSFFILTEKFKRYIMKLKKIHYFKTSIDDFKINLLSLRRLVKPTLSKNSSISIVRLRPMHKVI